ncbi:MAG: undecaprenyldiphospho-muramoylpentapeptide beta-N-acetylglucosaminyltransferase [Candidatus Aureabacteria bacterium]|nr:undecaprenyldiphospho-muramoylpentapeptide beta-N-acetylglucosaminyltransferase [Candidatus Auribacterota bacterium]
MRIAFAAGGTAGHLYPALCAAMELRRRHAAFEALFLISRRGREREILEEHGFAYEELAVSGFGQVLSYRMLPAMAGMLGAFRRAFSLLRGKGMSALVGFGAYVSVAPAFAARLLGMRLIIHEQNAVMGRANRILARFADRICMGLPLNGEPAGTRGKCVFTGIPLRPEVREGVRREDALACLGLPKAGFTALIMGGSQGAHAINRIAMEGAETLAENKIQVIHLSGGKDYGAVHAAYARARVSAVVFPYLREMQWAYAAADLVVGRCGAMSLAEIAYAGLPSVLIPYPHATGDHQAANGRVFERNGAALLMREEEVSAGTLLECILSLGRDAVRRARMAEAAHALAVPDADRRLADVIEETIRST